jgi:hypothetical protein
MGAEDSESGCWVSCVRSVEDTHLFHYGLPDNTVGGSDNIALRADVEQQLNWREMKRS